MFFWEWKKFITSINCLSLSLSLSLCMCTVAGLLNTVTSRCKREGGREKGREEGGRERERDSDMSQVLSL